MDTVKDDCYALKVSCESIFGEAWDRFRSSNPKVSEEGSLSDSDSEMDNGLSGD